MRGVLLTWLLLAVLQSLAQQANGSHPTVSDVVEGMRGQKWAEREKAFGEAAELLASSNTSEKDVELLRLGIIHLLVHENSGGLREPDDVTAETHGEGYGEDKAEYYVGLIELVASLKDARAIPALLGAASSGDIAIRAVVDFGKEALDPTLAQAQNPDPDLASGALHVIRVMLATHTLTDFDSKLRIKNTLRLNLSSTEYRIREGALGAVEYLDDRQEFVPLLRDIAERDPYKSPYNLGGGSEEDRYQVRRRARLLLLKIANNEQPLDP